MHAQLNKKRTRLSRRQDFTHILVQEDSSCFFGRRSFGRFRRITFLLLWSSIPLFALSSLLQAKEPPQADASPPKPLCIPAGAPAKDMPRGEVYQGVPFQVGEEARYTVKYGLLKVHVGYGYLRVKPPTKYDVAISRQNDKSVKASRWHRVFEAEAYTGEWFKLIFIAHDKLQVFSRPWDQAATKFYISQDEEKPFVRRFLTEKWLDFDHVACEVHERTLNRKKNKETQESHPIEPGAIDALSAFYRLRTFDYQPGKIERFLVYTSQKSWWFEAKPLEIETVETPIGKFKAQKLGVQAFLGKELQQKGTLYIWIATDHPSRPMVKVEGELSFGSAYLILDQFTPGKAL